jgi:signal peptidase I
MKAATGDIHGWFDLSESVRRESRRRQLQALLVRRFLSLRSVVRLALLSVLVLVLLKASLVEAFFVPSASMKPTLQEHDYILVPKFLFGLHLPLVDDVLVKWSKPHRGDVIVFNRRLEASSEGNRLHEALVKRVIALEGDLIEICGNQVVLNGRYLVEPYARWERNREGQRAAPQYHFGPSRVPVGTVFVLGDNRDNSEDSRRWGDPFVPLSQVVGKAVLVYWSGAHENRVGTVL